MMRMFKSIMAAIAFLIVFYVAATLFLVNQAPV